MFATEHQTEGIPKPLADIIREETNDGRHIVRFLIDVMQGNIDDSKPCHRLDAARQLLNLGFHGAQTVIQSVSQPTNGRAPSRAANVSRFDQVIADIIKLETSDGRDAVRFLVDVMQGNLGDFKPHHRIAAAKELLRRGFDNSPDHTNDEYEDHDESFDDDPGSPNYVDPNANRYNNEDDPFDFENYDEEQFMRDRDGERALRHIYGSEEAVTIAHEAVARHRQQTIFDESHIPDRDFTPIENPSMTLVEKATTGTTPCASPSATTSPSGSPTGRSRNSRSEWPNTMGPTIARHAATQDGLVTTPSPPSANPLNTQTVSSPSRTNPPKTLTPESPNWFNPRKTRTPAIPNLVNPTALKTLPYLSFLSAPSHPESL